MTARWQVCVIEHKCFSEMGQIAAHLALRGAGHVGTLTVVSVQIGERREREGVNATKGAPLCEKSKT